MASKPISTFVFFDLEATGLADTSPRITELSMVAVHRESLHAPCEGHMPRTLNKLTICIDPKKPIPPIVSQITGLHNDELSYQRTFDLNVVEMCRSFLSQLASPVCLLAHNGSSFDFPLLAAELEKVGGSLPDQVMCADTLHGFHTVDLPLPSPSRPNISPRDNKPEAEAAQNIRNPPQPLRVRSPDQLHLSTDVTPEMQIIKQDLKRFSNAPEKRKPKPDETPRSLRATSIKRKLFDECPNATSRCNDMMEDDVDRNIDANVFQMSKGFAKDQSEPVLNTIEDEKMVTDEQEVMDGEMCQNVSVSYGQLQMDKANDVADHDAAETAISQKTHSETYTHTLKITQGGSTISAPPVTTQQLPGGATVSRENMGEAQPVPQIETLQEVISPESSQPMSEAESEQPMTPETSASQTQTVTTPTTVVVSETFLTPSPSPHRAKPDQSSSCSVSPASSSQGTPVRMSYSLAALHRRILGYDFPDVHRAEGDCLALVRLFHKMPAQLCEWVDIHAVPFNSITPLSTPSKRQRTS